MRAMVLYGSVDDDPPDPEELDDRPSRFVKWAGPSWRNGLWTVSQAAGALDCGRGAARRMLESMVRDGILYRYSGGHK